MKTGYWLDQIPLWGIFVFTVALIVLSFLAGTYLGNRKRPRPEHHPSLSTVCGALLGLLAFMLAFTFGITAGRFQASRLFLLDEVNAIETTYLRARLLPPPHGDQVSGLLRQYAAVRTELISEATAPHEKLAETLARSQDLQNQLWAHAVTLAEADRYSEIDALFIDSLNEMIDLQTSRVTVFSYRVPQIVWECLFFIAVMSMLITGYQAGLTSGGGFKIGLVLALTFASVILLIADLDRGWEGRLLVNQKPMLELLQRMQPPESE